MEGINFIQDLSIVLLGAGIAGSLCKRVGLSVVVGYLLAGIVIGPYTPPFPLVLDVQRIETLSQIGLVFLMFAIGLGLSLTNLRKMGASTLMATALGAFFVLNLTQILGRLVDWPPQQTLFVAAMFMVSSSAVIAKIIRDMNLSHERSGQLALGVTVLEDVVAVVMLAVLGAQVDTTGSQAIGFSGLLTNLSAFVVLLVLTGLFFIPKLLRRFEADPDWELLTTIIAGVVLFMSLLAVKAGYSLALGAFLLGAIIAEMPQKSGVEKSFSGLRDMFSSVFFVSIGMMIDVQLMFDVWPWILGLGLFTLAARAVSTGLALILLGTPPHQARQAGLTLMPVGEFTFVIAQLGVASQILPPEFYPIAVGVSLFTVFLTPLINRHAGPLLQAIEKAEPLWLHRSLEVYHNWLAQLGTLQSGQSWWLMSKKYLLLVALEMLFVTGLLGFSERMLSAFQQSPFANALSPEKTLLVFWVVIGLLALVPLFAIWRNFLALANIFAVVAANRTRLLGPIVDTCFKAFSALGLAYWLYLILPVASLPHWAWLAIAVGLTATLVIFSRRLIYWHSQWQDSVKEALADHQSPEVSPQWLDRSDGWGLSVQEFIVPARAACAGRAIAELGVRSRYGCSIVEIDRQGHTIIAPEPAQALFSGDRLLLLGSPAQIASARAGLSEIKAGNDVTIFDQARLEAVTLPEGPLIGQSLAQLQIPRRTGVLVTAINRRGAIITNPMGSEALLKGDELLVLGSPEQIRAMREWLVQEEVRPNRQQPLEPGAAT